MPEPSEADSGQPPRKNLFRPRALARLHAPNQATAPPTRAATGWRWLLAGVVACVGALGCLVVLMG